jgi:hypothetical protein
MTNPTDLTTLASAVAEAKGPSRELDAALSMWAHPLLRDLPRTEAEGWVHPEFGRIAPSSPYTDSIDAALELVERMLPGWGFTLDRYIISDDPKARGCWRTFLTDYSSVTDDDDWPTVKIPKFVGRGDTPALAILSALLTTLAAQEKSHGG